MAGDSVRNGQVFIAPNATVLGDVTLGHEISIWYGAVIRADKDRIVIGDRSNIQDNAVLHTSSGHPVLIGTEVSIGHGAILHGCRIADRVLVGMGAIILNGAEISFDRGLRGFIQERALWRQKSKQLEQGKWRW